MSIFTRDATQFTELLDAISSKTLAFDTASERGSTALLEGTELRAELRSNAVAGHSEHLLETVNSLLCRTGWTLKDLTLIAVGIGPGSFTGIRIGVATGIGLAQSLGIPLVGVSGLDAIAASTDIQLKGCISVLLDARRGQFYFAKYEKKNGRLRRSGKPALIDAADTEKYLADTDWITGDLDDDRARVVDESLSGTPRWVAADLFLAESIGRLGLKRKRSWRSGDFLTADPLYIRPPDAVKSRRNER